MTFKGQHRVPLEIIFTAEKDYADPFNEIEMDVVFTDEEGKSLKVPAFWAGGKTWKVRFAAPRVGTYTYVSHCTDALDSGLNNVRGELEASPYTGDCKLYQHGPIRVMKNKRYLEHEDGTPFPWLGDTWWMVFSKRVNCTDEIQTLVNDRVEKGFTIIQLIAGLWCDVHAYDRRGENENGYCWEKDWARINPYFYDIADKKMNVIVNAGLVPVLAGAWGFYMKWMGVKKMKQHYRYMIARYGAYPLIWNVGGEVCMPGYYDDVADDQRKKDWAEVLDYMMEIDPYHRLVVAHETAGVLPGEGLPNVEKTDIYMFQGTHSESHDAIAEAVGFVDEVYKADSIKPVINGETCYEGMLNCCGPEIQRMIFWNTALRGGEGWTYGSQGVWAASHEKDPFGPSAYGMTWGYHSWQDSMHFPGGKQVGNSRKFLNRFKWWELIPAQDMITRFEDVLPFYQPACAKIEDNDTLIAFVPVAVSSKNAHASVKYCFSHYFKGLTPGDRYVVTAYDAVRDEEIELYVTEVDEKGELPLISSSYQEWVYVAKKTTIRHCTHVPDRPLLFAMFDN